MCCSIISSSSSSPSYLIESKSSPLSATVNPRTILPFLASGSCLRLHVSHVAVAVEQTPPQLNRGKGSTNRDVVDQRGPMERDEVAVAMEEKEADPGK